jgi:hypothetical protein
MATMTMSDLGSGVHRDHRRIVNIVVKASAVTALQLYFSIQDRRSSNTPAVKASDIQAMRSPVRV